MLIKAEDKIDTTNDILDDYKSKVDRNIIKSVMVKKDDLQQLKTIAADVNPSLEMALDIIDLSRMKSPGRPVSATISSNERITVRNDLLFL